MDYYQWIQLYSQFFDPGGWGGYRYPIYPGYLTYPGYGQQKIIHHPPSHAFPPHKAQPGSSQGSGAFNNTYGSNQPINPTSSSGGLGPLPPPRQGHRNPELNPQASFLSRSANTGKRGFSGHPKAAGYPQNRTDRPPRVEDMTPEEQSARAFMLTTTHLMNYPEFAEDMYSLYQKGRVSEELAGQIRYFLFHPLQHIMDGKEVPPGDYCKMRALLDRCAEVGESFGGALVWSDGFGKRNGKAREKGWWRKERHGFTEGPSFNSNML